MEIYRVGDRVSFKSFYGVEFTGVIKGFTSLGVMIHADLLNHDYSGSSEFNIPNGYAVWRDLNEIELEVAWMNHAIDGQKIRAIKNLRDRTGLGLVEAKKLVEDFIKWNERHR